MLPDVQMTAPPSENKFSKGVVAKRKGSFLTPLEIHMKMYDVDGDGKFSVEEVTSIVADLEDSQKNEHRWKQIALLATMLSVLALAAMVGTSMWGAELVKEQHVSSDGVVGSLDGQVLKMTPALMTLPLIVAPVLPSKLHPASLNLKYASPTYVDDRGEAVEVSETLELSRIVRVNDTYITLFPFTPPAGTTILVKEVRVWNGDTTALLSDGSLVPL